MDYLILNDMRFFARHGVLESERQTGTYFTVSLKLGMDLATAGHSDCLDDTLNYARVFDLVARRMERPVNLIEHLAETICQDIRREFPDVGSLEIRLSKEHPPVAGEMASAEVVLQR